MPVIMFDKDEHYVVRTVEEVQFPTFSIDMMLTDDKLLPMSFGPEQLLA